MLLSPDLNLTLRPMQYPQFFKLYKDSIKNIWTTDELDFSIDFEHIRDKLNPKEAHLIKRLVAFFATADGIVIENLEVSEEEVNENSSFVQDLRADSLDTVELVMALEDEFEIEIPDEEAEKITTVKQAVDYITAQLEG